MPGPGALIDPMTAFLLALAAALAMGFAIQRGGTCMVAAVDQLISKKSATKLLVLLECSLWTSGLGLGAISLGLHFAASPGYTLGLTTFLGGLLLGLGASINGACVFGSVARIGSRDWNYLLALPGFFLGSLAHHHVIGAASSAAQSMSAGVWTEPLFVLLAGSLAYGATRAWRGRRTSGPLFDYRLATISIGFAFVVLAVMSGPWTYTEVFSRVAHGGAAPSIFEAALLGALLAGAVIGGWNGARGGGFRVTRALQCLVGGMLMGAGSSLIPGGNDNLILVGLPSFQSHAWLAILSMVMAIVIWLKVGEFWRNLAAAREPGRANSA